MGEEFIDIELGCFCPTPRKGGIRKKRPFEGYLLLHISPDGGYLTIKYPPSF